MLHSNLKFNITTTTSFQDTKVEKPLGMSSKFGRTKRKSVNNCIYLIALGHQTSSNIIPNS